MTYYKLKVISNVLHVSMDMGVVLSFDYETILKPLFKNDVTPEMIFLENISIQYYNFFFKGN
jgi:hypothetical protein